MRRKWGKRREREREWGKGREQGVDKEWMGDEWEMNGECAGNVLEMNGDYN